MSDPKVISTKFRKIAIASIAYGGLHVVGVTLLSKVYHIPTPFSLYIWSPGFVLMVAGLISLVSIKYGYYLYLFSAFFTLLRYFCANQSHFELSEEIPSVILTVVAITSMPVGLTFVLSIIGVTICRSEKKKMFDGKNGE